MNKKYFSIHEASEITGLPAHRLRYAEKAIPGLKIHQIRSRRYYTHKDIAQIKDYYNLSIEKIIPAAKLAKAVTVERIDRLIAKFEALLV